MYHRVHSPVDGRVVAWRYVPGRLFPVNGAGVRSVPGLFTRNERVAVFLDTEAHGPVAVVLVGAANVGRMSLAFADLVTNRGRPGGRVVPGETVAIRRGDESRRIQPRLHGPGSARRPRAVSRGGRGRPRPGGPGPVATRLTVGVVSDTHGLVRPEAIEALRGSDVILHAGDIGGNHVLQELGEIAPVISVRGNVDGGWARLLPERRRARPRGHPGAHPPRPRPPRARPVSDGRRGCERSGIAARLRDDAKPSGRPRSRRASTPALQGIVVFGHSHQPLAERKGACSGSTRAAPGRGVFQLPVSVGRLVIEDGRVRHHLLTL